MPFSWPEIHAHLLDSTTTLRFRTTFDHLRSGSPHLRAFRDPAGLVGYLHGRDGDPEDKNKVLADLVRTAQAAGPEANDAVVLLLLALWPGLDAARGRLRALFRDRPDDLAAEITGRITEAIRDLDLGRVNRIAATLLMNLERDIRREAIREQGKARADVPLEEVDLTQGDADLRPEIDHEALLAHQHDLLRQRIGCDAGLVLAIAVEDCTRVEAAARFGITPETAKKRYQRAMARLRQDCPGTCPRSRPRLAFPS